MAAVTGPQQNHLGDVQPRALGEKGDFILPAGSNPRRVLATVFIVIWRCQNPRDTFC